MAEDETENTKGNALNKAWAWLCGSHPQGLGTLLIGFAALIALYQGSSLLDQVLKIQSQAQNIDIAVSQLREQSKQMTTAIDLLALQIKEMKAKSTVEMSPTLQLESPSKKQIEEAIRAIPLKPSSMSGSVFIPESRYEATVNKLYGAKTGQERTTILQNAMEYSPQWNKSYPASNDFGDQDSINSSDDSIPQQR